MHRPVERRRTGAIARARRASRARRRRARTRSARADGARPPSHQHAQRRPATDRRSSCAARSPHGTSSSKPFDQRESTSGSACGRGQPSTSAAPARRATHDPPSLRDGTGSSACACGATRRGKRELRARRRAGCAHRIHHPGRRGEGRRLHGLARPRYTAEPSRGGRLCCELCRAACRRCVLRTRYEQRGRSAASQVSRG